MEESFFENGEFIIRPHHLQKFLELRSFNGNVDAFLGSLINVIYSRADEVIAPGITYSYDVLGSSSEQRMQYENGVRKYIDIYNSLEDESPVRIGSFMDGLCFSCAIGEHCRRNLVDQRYNYGEGRAVELFIDLARRANLLNSITVIDPSESSVRTVITNKRTVDKLISAAIESDQHFVTS